MYATCTVPRFHALRFQPRAIRHSVTPVSGRQTEESRSSFIPRANVITDAEGYRIMIELPGVKKEELRISFADEVLTVSGEKKSPTGSEGTWIRRESVDGGFERRFRFRRPIDPANITARFADGVVEIAVPFAEEAKSREIEIH